MPLVSAAGSTKIDVQSLFSQASNSTDPQAKKKETETKSSKPPSKPASRVVSNDEFAAMFRSLEEVHVAEEEKKQNTEEEVGFETL